MPSRRVIALLALLASCRKEQDLTDASVRFAREPAGLHAADFRPYRLTIDANGVFEFVAIGLDEIERSRTGVVPPVMLVALFEAAEETEFFELSGKQGQGVNDGISATLELEAGSRSNVVRCDNCWDAPLEEIRELGLRLEPEAHAIQANLARLGDTIDEAIDRSRLLEELIAEEMAASPPPDAAR